MAIMFVNDFLLEQPNFIPVLTRSLACFVHHSDEIYSYMVQHTGHPLQQLKLLHLSNQDLLKRLKSLVTTDPTEGVMTECTGIPPHVHQNRIMNEMLSSMKSLLEQQQSLAPQLKAAIYDEFEKRAIDNGQPTIQSMNTLINNLFERFEGNINKKLIHFRRELGGRNTIIDDTNGFDCNNDDSSILSLNGTEATNNRTKRPTTQFVCNGRFYSVQQNF